MTDEATQRMSKFDDSGFEVIVFDERYSEGYPRKIIFATGDASQLETVGLISNQLDYETYMNHRVNTSFPSKVKLHEDKR